MGVKKKRVGERMRATLRSIGDGVIVCDGGGRVESLNRVAETLTGWTTAEAAGRPAVEVFRIVDAQSRAEAINPVEQALRQGTTVGLANHTVLVARDGAEHQIADSCAPISDDSGEVIGAVFVFRDVTAEYRRREQLRESEERFCQSDVTDRKRAEEALKQSQDIVKNVQYGLYVYHLEKPDDDRTLRMVAANPATETLTGVKVCDIVGKTLDENFPYLRAMNVPQPSDLQGVRALIVDDNATVREILTIRMASWGMRLAEAQDGPAALYSLYRALDENDPFRIAVVDMQMPGMSGEALCRAIKADDRIAETKLVMLTSMGKRGDSRHFQEIGFTGYATKPIRHEELRGVLSQALAERAGKDATPAPIATRHTAREALDLLARRKGRILLAEDNVTNQQVATAILAKLGMAVDAVADGREAVAALKNIPYDLVFMDVQMPEMDGLEATRKIREWEAETGRSVAGPSAGVSGASSGGPEARTGRIPIVAMTAQAMKGDCEKCLDAGMDGYVSKPVSPAALAEVIATWLTAEPHCS